MGDALQTSETLSQEVQNDIKISSWAIGATASTYMLGYAKAPREVPRDFGDLGVALELAGTKGGVSEVFRDARAGESLVLVELNRARSTWVAQGGSKYLVLTAQLPNGCANGLLLHPQATIAGIQAEHDWFLVARKSATGAALATRLGAGLRMATVLPFREHWLPALWREGMQHDLVVPLRCFGSISAHRVSGSTDEWANLVERLFESLNNPLLAEAPA